jgi:hypothetical protein
MKQELRDLPVGYDAHFRFQQILIVGGKCGERLYATTNLHVSYLRNPNRALLIPGHSDHPIRGMATTDQPNPLGSV